MPKFDPFGPLPCAVIPMSPAVTARIAEGVAATSAAELVSATSCLMNQEVGDRAVIYETGPDGAGLVAWVDFSESASRHPESRWAAQSPSDGARRGS